MSGQYVKSKKRPRAKQSRWQAEKSAGRLELVVTVVRDRQAG
jgi:hypothetical protein